MSSAAPARLKARYLSICDDQAVIFKDIVPAIRHELQERDDPIMYLQVVLRLLGRALPEGPSSVTANKKLDVTDEKAPLRVRKGDSAQLEFGAPWRAQGSANPGGQGQIRFELALNYADKARGGARSELKLSGIWQHLSRLRALDKNFPLQAGRFTGLIHSPTSWAVTLCCRQSRTPRPFSSPQWAICVRG